MERMAACRAVGATGVLSLALLSLSTLAGCGRQHPLTLAERDAYRGAIEVDSRADGSSLELRGDLEFVREDGSFLFRSADGRRVLRGSLDGVAGSGATLAVDGEPRSLDGRAMATLVVLLQLLNQQAADAAISPRDDGAPGYVLDAGESRIAVRLDGDRAD